MSDKDLYRPEGIDDAFSHPEPEARTAEGEAPAETGATPTGSSERAPRATGPGTATPDSHSSPSAGEAGAPQLPDGVARVSAGASPSAVRASGSGWLNASSMPSGR